MKTQVLLLSLAACALCHHVAFSDWSQWRGPSRDGRVAASEPQWPESLQGRLTLLWEKELSHSYSGPLVVGDLLYTTESTPDGREAVHAFDRLTGEGVWEHAWQGSMKVPFFARKNGSWIRSTPSVVDGRIYVGGMLDVLVCMDAADGKELWRVDFKERYQAKKPAFGMVCSPLVVDGFVYVQAGGAFCKLNAETGASMWKTLDDGGGMYGSAFSSPVLTEVDGTPMLLVLTRTKLCGVAPGDGKVLWEQPVEAFRGMNILTPVVHGNRVFTSAYGGRSHAFDLTRDGEEWTVAEAWNQKFQGYMCSPVQVDEHVYFHLRNERFASLNLTDGSIGFVSGETYGKYMSLVRQGDRLLGLGERGKLFLMQATPDAMTVVDEVDVSEQQTWAHLAVDEGLLYIRELKGLRVYRWK